MTATSSEMDALQKSVGTIQEFLDVKARKDADQSSFTTDPGRIALVYEYDPKAQKFKNFLLLRSDLERLVAFVAAASIEVESAPEVPSQ